MTFFFYTKFLHVETLHEAQNTPSIQSTSSMAGIKDKLQSVADSISEKASLTSAQVDKAKTIAKTALKASAIVFRSLLLYVIGGVLIGAILTLLIFYWGKSLDTMTVTGISAIVFLVLFPVLYFLAGKKNGIQRAGNFLVSEHKEFLFEYISTKFFESHLGSRLGNAAATQTLNYHNDIRPKLNQYIAELNGVPSLLKPIVQKKFAKLDVVQRLESNLRQIPEHVGTDELAFLLKDAAGEKLSDMFAPGFSPFLVVLGIELVVFVGIKYFFL
jgi:hypothetical protein